MLDSQRTPLRGYILILIAAICWATIGIFYRAIIDQYRLSQSVIVAYRIFLVFGIVGVAGFFRFYVIH